MKVLAPIAALEEFEPLVESGAEEFYCGVTPPDWLLAMGKGIWMNRRSPRRSDLRSVEELQRLVALSHGACIPVYLTLNAPAYPGVALRYVVELARVCAEDCGIDAVILSDLALLLELQRRNLKLDLHLSSLASCFNAEAVRFFQALGIRRIILPRQLHLAEMERLLAAVPDMAFEAFILNDGCWFDEGLCHTTHHLGAFCLVDWKYGFLKRPAGDKTEQWRGHLEDFQEFLWYADNCGSSFTPPGPPLGPCGLCALPALRRMGITSVKVVGREAGLPRKTASVRLVRTVVERVRAGDPPQAVCQYAQELRNTPEKCASGYMCYYREAERSRSP